MTSAWTKEAAVTRAASNARLQELLAREPRLKPVLEAAIAQENVQGYRRIRAYEELKSRALRLVGWEAANPALHDSEHYDPVINAISDLLPPDDVDLYPDGKPESDLDE